MMEFAFENSNGDCPPFSADVVRCPFLQNINEPTNLSFSRAKAFPMPATREEKGPIFEDGPNFDMAFRLFHGQNGVVPLSERSFIRHEKHPSESSLSQFNPLAAKAATISLSSFGHGGPFGFDAFSEMWKNSKNKSNSSKRDSSSKKGKSQHEATSNEWLQTGNCPISKSYRAVNRVLPLVAKALQPPPGVHLKCPPAIIAARAAISKTAFAKNLRPQPLPAKVLVIGILGMAANIPLGVWREHTEKFSPSWFVAVHAAVPFIGMLRKSVLMPKSAMAFTIAASILGQVIGSRAERYRLKMVESGSSLAGASQAAAAGVHGGGCSDVAVWKPDSLQLSSSSADVFGWLQRIRNGQITIDGCVVTDPDTIMRESAELVYHRLPWKEPNAPYLLEILYEDNDVIALNKPPGLQVLPGGLFQQRTVLTQLQRHAGNLEASGCQEPHPVPVHRLGRGTSGVLLCAKTKLAKCRLAAYFADGTSFVGVSRNNNPQKTKARSITKLYRALASGVIVENEVVIDHPIGLVKYPGVAQGLETGLEQSYSSAKNEQNNSTLLQVEIKSGRPHQIRIHLSFIGHPLIGDPLYGTDGQPKHTDHEIVKESFAQDGGYERPEKPVPGDCGYHLHAHRVVFPHPETNEIIEIVAPLPPILRMLEES